ncbi:MAG TPA: serine/threonine-protein kinase, partial [Pyrinomonadaceae bacterium]|nr:serine/threonine-protein kinase [Pyrinomonadaceae bacterium]
MKRESEIAELFAAVSELEPNAQDVFLKEKCDDVFLREEIEELLGSFGKAQKNSFMSASALEIEAEYLTEIEESDSRINEVIGRYKILEKIGAGGMGAIYLAARTDDFQKRVAVKIVKRGMDSDAILRRFRNERQILANLEHPNVARLIDAGTTADGLPFFVMEYVAGKPVNLYCQEHNLTIEQRLDLFRQICAAVEFAHRKIIVHRDLKPSNILVTEDGVPKLLDFGIAKLLDSSNEDETKTNQRVLTPAYASPEQINGEKIITPATDVYSLGVILYELLTGNRPFPATQDGLDKTKRINSEPARPSLVLSGEKSFGVKTSDENATVGGERKSKSLNAKSLRGNLDNIVLKAMRREPERRYQTAAEFSEDIERHLKNLPVRARPATVSYRVSSFARRNRSLVTIVAVAVFALTLFAGVSAFQYLRGQRQLGELQKMNENLTAAVASGSSIQARTDLARATVEQLNALSSGVGGD